MSSKTWIWIRIQIHPKSLYPDPDSSNMNSQYRTVLLKSCFALSSYLTPLT